jgi:hypothetical protein
MYRIKYLKEVYEQFDILTTTFSNKKPKIIKTKKHE